MVVDDDEDEEEGRGDGGLANVTRPGVGHGILTQLGESERSRNSVTLSASSSATRSQWQYATTAEGHTVESLSDSATWRSSSRRRRKLPHACSCPNVLEREKQSLACSAVRMAAQKGETSYISHQRLAHANDDVV